MISLPKNPQDTRSVLEYFYGHPEKDAMSPYQRCKEAVNLRPPDRVPFDFWAVPEVWDKLRAYFNAVDDEEVLRLLGVDVRLVEPDYIGPPIEFLPDGSFYMKGMHRRRVTNDFSTYEEYASFPLAQVQSVAEVETYARWPRAEDFDWHSFAPKVRTINEKTRYYIRYDIGGIFESSWALYGLDKFLVDLYDRPEIPCAIMDCWTDYFIARFRNLMRSAAGYVDMVYTYDDVATQNNLMMSPKMWRKYILPRHQRLNAVIREYDVRLMYHSCGAIYPLIPALIEDMGIHILNPLQPRAAMMDMQRIKDEFGGKIAFHGGIDLQETMVHGTPQDVVNEVRERCSILGNGGGYICATAHYIQNDTPLENILAMYTARRTLEA